MLDVVSLNKLSTIQKLIDNKAENLSGNIIFGFKVIQGREEPYGRVEYTDENENFNPAYMDFTTGCFNYGSWKNAWFMPKPCMLKSDGTVDYYLDPDDYTYKEDGTVSDIARTSYDGNAMMQWPKIWIKRTVKGNTYICKIANYKVDNTYKCYSNIDKNNNEIPYFYTPIYNGSLISSKVRSLSGQSVMNGQTGSNEITYATANGTHWYIEQLSDRMLVNDLLILIGHSTNMQKVFGNGHYTGGSSASNLITTGSMNDKGLFWGTNGTGKGVKVFGMEHYWGNQWRRTAGLLFQSGKVYAKATRGTADGTTVSEYQQTSVTGYKKVATLAQSLSSSYIKYMTVDDFGLFPNTGGAGEQTYYSDGIWTGTTSVTFALFGGTSDDGWADGPFALALSSAVSTTNWYFGASLSCKPPVSEG